MSNLEELVSMVWSDIKEITNQADKWISERAILCPRNDAVNNINQIILDGIDSPVCNVIYIGTFQST